jgi:riboflavin kinase / FMN adenylyltransferase
MRVIRHVAHAGPAARPRVVAAGEFDGVHRGHQALLARVVERAAAMRGESAVVVAFGAVGTPRLLSRRQQLERLRDAGIGVIAFAPREAAAAAVERLGAVLRLAARGSAAVAPVGGQLDTLAPLRYGGVPITTDAIRAALARGELATVRAMLGRDPGVAGRVVHGFHRGSQLGVPTANLRVRGIQLPPDGVYAVRAEVDGTRLLGVANIGFNPTFGNQTRTVESHLLDFSGDLYGRRLELAFVRSLRGERKFPDVAALVTQIRADIEAARRHFARYDG